MWIIFDAAKNDPRTVDDFEAEHRTDPPLDGPVILFDAVVQVLALPDADRLQPAIRMVLQAVRRVTRQDGFPVGLAPVHDNALGPATGVAWQLIVRMRLFCSGWAFKVRIPMVRFSN
jgi:hypothetical protein